MLLKLFFYLGFGSLKLWQKCFDEVSLAMLGSLSFAASLYWTAFLEDDLSYYLGRAHIIGGTYLIQHYQRAYENNGRIFKSVIVRLNKCKKCTT